MITKKSLDPGTSELLDVKANFEAEDEYGQTPLSWAAQNGHTEVVKLLLDVKANIKAEDKSGQTPLSLAAQNGHTEVVKLLLDVKANFEAEDKNMGGRHSVGRHRTGTPRW